MRLAVRAAWEPIKKMIDAPGIPEFQRACRILAVLICPAPEKREAVQDGALLPLAKVFPADWIQRLQEGFGGV